MKVLFITNVPSPYRVDFFNELGKYCQLTVAFEKRTSNERDKSWLNYKFENFAGVFLKGISINTDTAICFGIKKVIKKGKFDKIICASFTSPTGMIAIRYMRRKKIPYYLESDGGFAKDGKGFKEKLKKYFIQGAQGYFSTAKEHDHYYITYGAEKNRIYRYPFTSIKQKAILKNAPTEERKAELRGMFGIKEKKVILAVGQFIHRKGFDLLIKAASNMSKGIAICFVGGVPTQEYIALKEELHLSNIYFVGFKSKADLNEYYQMANVFVLPTREDVWGLVINEAMSNGLPVITTDKCIAGLELVKNDINGYIVPVNNVNELRKKILLSLERADEFSLNSLKIIEKYTIENMAKVHGDFLCLGERY